MVKIDENILFGLVALGLGNECATVSLANLDWKQVVNLSSRQGVSAICLDGFQILLKRIGNENVSFGDSVKLRWIASVIRQEQTYKDQWVAAKSLSSLYSKYGIVTYVLKGFSLSRLYPKTNHRSCSDMDCFLAYTTDTVGYQVLNENGHDLRCAYEDGNRIAEGNGITVDCSYYKHSKIFLNGLTVENHQFLLPIKGSGKAKKFERELRTWIDDGHNECIGDSQMMAPSPFFDTVYVLAHAQEHFLNEGLVLRHICDWAMVLRAYASKVDWSEWRSVSREYGMLSFGYAMSRLANKICGVPVPFACPRDEKADRRLINDILYGKRYDRKDKSEWQVRVNLVRNMFANRWKYRMFSDTNFLVFCGKRVWGYLFDKES